jgi:hypothetical protein
VLVGAAILIATRRTAQAQTGIAVGLEGGPELLLPTGARGLGSAQAIVAGGIGSEALFRNPALIAHAPREVAFNFAQQSNGVVVADATAAIVWPVKRVGGFALTVRYVNEGEQESLNDQQQVVGSFVTVGVIVGGTFAAQFGNRLAAGLTLKFLQLGSPCTGSCDLPPSPPRTAAVDFGAQYFLTKDSLIAIGASGLNFGLPLQVNDSPQADPLPRRAVIGVAVAPRFPQLPKEARIRGEVDMIKAISIGGPGFLFGGEVAWMDQYSARVGYQRNGGIGTSGSGPTFGVGFATAKLHIDFAQVVTDVGSFGRPTYLSLRYVF